MKYFYLIFLSLHLLLVSPFAYSEQLSGKWTDKAPLRFVRELYMRRTVEISGSNFSLEYKIQSKDNRELYVQTMVGTVAMKPNSLNSSIINLDVVIKTNTYKALPAAKAFIKQSNLKSCLTMEKPLDVMAKGCAYLSPQKGANKFYTIAMKQVDGSLLFGARAHAFPKVENMRSVNLNISPLVSTK